MKGLLLGLEWGWAHLHHIGVHKPVTSKITQEALQDSHPSNRLGFAWQPAASISSWQHLTQSKFLILYWKKSVWNQLCQTSPIFFLFFKGGTANDCPMWNCPAPFTIIEKQLVCPPVFVFVFFSYVNICRVRCRLIRDTRYEVKDKRGFKIELNTKIDEESDSVDTLETGH